MQTYNSNCRCLSSSSPGRNDDCNACRQIANLTLVADRARKLRAPFKMALRVCAEQRTLQHSQANWKLAAPQGGSSIFLPISWNKRSELPNICVGLNIVQIKLGASSFSAKRAVHSFEPPKFLTAAFAKIMTSAAFYSLRMLHQRATRETEGKAVL